jgi:hypothetical protein
MSYKLYSDKSTNFICEIKLEGTSISNTKARLLIECDDISYMFNGNIQNDGTFQVIVPKSKSFLSERKKGFMKLEVIADDVLFEPWSSDFSVVSENKINVTAKPKIVKEVTVTAEIDTVLNEMMGDILKETKPKKNTITNSNKELQIVKKQDLIKELRQKFL